MNSNVSNGVASCKINTSQSSAALQYIFLPDILHGVFIGVSSIQRDDDVLLLSLF